MVRRVFDELERKWQLEAKVEEERAINLKLDNDDNYKEILSEFTERCVLEAIKTTENLKNIIKKEERKINIKLANDDNYKEILSEINERCVLEAIKTAKNLKNIIQEV